MKGLFLDAVDDLATVFHHVVRPADPPMDVVERGEIKPDELSALIAEHFPVPAEFLDQAVDSRRKILEHVAENNALYFGTHFAGNSAGTIIRDNGGYSWTSA